MNLLKTAATEKRDFAFELKFLIPGEVAGTVLDWARKNLSPDPFAGGSTGDAYKVNSIYLDTPKFDVFHRVGSFGRCKYRVRRYGSEASVFLERKLKTRGQVGKRRTKIPDYESVLLAAPEADPRWNGFWFHRRLLARGVQPQCQIAYERNARVGAALEGPIRLTLDQNLRAFPTTGWKVEDSGPWTPLLDGRCILELKYRLSMPPLFSGMMKELGLAPQPVSKYRLAVQKFGWAADGEAAPSPNGVVVDAGFAPPTAATERELPGNTGAGRLGGA